MFSSHRLLRQKARVEIYLIVIVIAIAISITTYIYIYIYIYTCISIRMYTHKGPRKAIEGPCINQIPPFRPPGGRTSYYYMLTVDYVVLQQLLAFIRSNYDYSMISSAYIIVQYSMVWYNILTTLREHDCSRCCNNYCHDHRRYHEHRYCYYDDYEYHSYYHWYHQYDHQYQY